jgi:hypothetical protein
MRADFNCVAIRTHDSTGALIMQHCPASFGPLWLTAEPSWARCSSS